MAIPSLPPLNLNLATTAQSGRVDMGGRSNTQQFGGVTINKQSALLPIAIAAGALFAYKAFLKG